MRESIRFWRRRPIAAVTLIASIGLATAVATTTVAVANAVLWRDLPIRDPDQIVVVKAAVPALGLPGGHVPAQMYVLWKARQNAFDDLAAYQRTGPTTLRVDGRAEDIAHVRVSGNTFDLLGASPAAGRLFGAHDTAAGREDLAVLSHDAWTRLFGRDLSIVGRAVRLEEFGPEVTATIVGVAPPGLDLAWSLQDGVTVDLFTPLSDRVPPPDSARAYGWYVIGRLLPDVTPAVAQARMLQVAVAAHQILFPGAPAASAGGPNVVSTVPAPPTDVHVATLHEVLFGETRPFVRLLLASGILLMLIACAGAGGTMMMVSGWRARDVSIKQALGLSVRRLRYSLLYEGLALGLLAGGVAWLTAYGLVNVAVALSSASIPRMAATQLGWVESAVAGLLAAACGLVMGTIPAYAVRADTFTAVRGGTTTTLSKPTLRWRRGLLAAQVALVLVLLVASSLMLGTLRALLIRPLGFSTAGVLVAEVRLPSDIAAPADSVRSLQFFDRLRLAAESAAGNRTVAVTFDPPLREAGVSEVVRPTDDRSVHAVSARIGPGYFAALGVPLVAGRDFSDADAAGVMVSEAFAREYYGGSSGAVGRLVMRSGGPLEIVGVAADTRHRGLMAPMPPMIYLPLVSDQARRGLPGIVHLVSRERGDPARARQDLRRALQSVDRDLSVRVAPLADRHREQTAEARLLALSLSLFAGSTLLLSMFGIAALVGQLVTDRQRELAIRLVLGSSPRATVWLTMRVILGPALAGVAAGLVLAWWNVGLIRQFLFEIAPYDVRLWIAAAAILILATLLGAWWPARRVLRLEPAHALRGD